MSRPATTAVLQSGLPGAIGNTPLIALERLFRESNLKVFAKLEGCSPGGSIKDRTALSLIKAAVKNGTLKKDSVVIESSSGNLGIGLAQICRYLDIRFICVVDVRTSPQIIHLLELYGAEIEIVSEPDHVTGALLTARIKRVETLCEQIKHSYWPNQYENPANPAAHFTTMSEICIQSPSTVDFLFCPTSTCGTLRGCANYITQNELPTKIVVVDAAGSLITGDSHHPRLLPGLGAAINPPHFRPEVADHCIQVTDIDCVLGCRDLLRKEALLVGASSGGVVTALSQMNEHLPPDSVCVLILPDRGERYLDTVFSDEWVEQNLVALLNNEPRKTRRFGRV